VLIIQRANHSKVTANRAGWLRKRINTHAAPNGGPWLEVPLDASRDREIIFELLLKRQQSAIRYSQPLATLHQLRAFLCVNTCRLNLKNALFW